MLPQVLFSLRPFTTALKPLTSQAAQGEAAQAGDAGSGGAGGAGFGAQRPADAWDRMLATCKDVAPVDGGGSLQAGATATGPARARAGQGGSGPGHGLSAGTGAGPADGEGKEEEEAVEDGAAWLGPGMADLQRQVAAALPQHGVTRALGNCLSALEEEAE